MIDLSFTLLLVDKAGRQKMPLFVQQYKVSICCWQGLHDLYVQYLVMIVNAYVKRVPIKHRVQHWFDGKLEQT